MPCWKDIKRWITLYIYIWRGIVIRQLIEIYEPTNTRIPVVGFLTIGYILVSWFDHGTYEDILHDILWWSQVASDLKSPPETCDARTDLNKKNLDTADISRSKKETVWHRPFLVLIKKTTLFWWPQHSKPSTWSVAQNPVWASAVDLPRTHYLMVFRYVEDILLIVFWCFQVGVSRFFSICVFPYGSSIFLRCSTEPWWGASWPWGRGPQIAFAASGLLGWILMTCWFTNQKHRRLNSWQLRSVVEYCLGKMIGWSIPFPFFNPISWKLCFFLCG